MEDLTGRRTDSGPQAGVYPTGAWGAGESRDYHLCVRVTPGAVGQEMLAGRVSLIADSSSGPEVLGQGLVRAIWTDDEALSTRINKHVAHYTGQAELAQVIQEGLEATASRVTRTPRRPSSAGQWRLPSNPATRTRPGCWPKWSTWWTRRPGPCG